MIIAIITGASSGLGREFVHLADEAGAYDEIWAIARRTERLEKLAAECTTPVRPITLDLAEPDAIGVISALLGGPDMPAVEVGLLVNAAGFAKFGTYRDLTQTETDTMIDVNCRALADMTQAVIPYMGRRSRLIQIASCAAFQPLPGLNLYAASKAFVLSYTRALRFELRGTGIRATAVCPYWIKTEFVKVARDTKNGTTVKHPWPQLNPRHVARWSLLVNSANYPVATCHIISFLMRVFCKIVPAPLIMWIWEGIRRL
ncbi:MAG: SDR family NAD(P)-dependent oxidoreductase [Eggerthellaceae bacterium]|jgi:short-subunit dehydrogenase